MTIKKIRQLPQVVPAPNTAVPVQLIDNLTGHVLLENLVSWKNLSHVATAVGAGSFTIPSGVTRIRFIIVGAGAAGGGTAATANTAGGGGGSGGYVEHIVDVTPGTVITYSIGTAGTGNSAATGGNGTATTITVNGVTYSAGGGSGGTTTNGGAGGTNTGGTPLISVNGQQGGGGSTAALSGGAANVGGDVFKGYGLGGKSQNNATGSTGTGFGAGGGGAVTTAATARAGGNGTSGYVEIKY